MITALQTHIGRVRSVNEDRAAVLADMNGLTLAVVADGMGGHQAGDVASEMAIHTIQEELQWLDKSMTVEQCELALRTAIFKANDKVFRLASSQEQLHGMGTTVVAALIREEQVIVAHIGDSRAYLLQASTGSGMTQLTEDHTLVNELLKSKQITQEEAKHHPRRNVLTRALGTDPFVEIDVKHLLWQSHDVLLLCTDGLSGLVPAQKMTELVSSQKPKMAAEQLVHAALIAGGDDNITVVIVKYASEERGEAS